MANVISDYISSFYNRIFSSVSESAYFSALLEEVERKTGIPGPYIISALTTIIFLFFILGFGPYVVCDLAVVFYPAYRSYQAIENNDQVECANWIKYWIVFGVFHAAEHIGDSLLWWLPGYFLLKFFFLLWCFAPITNNGSVFIYDNYIQPTFLNNAETVDTVIQTVRRFSQAAVQWD